MNSVRSLKLNTITSLINQLIVLFSGLILPGFMLSYYGSEINGLASSITQFLSIITFLEMGLGGVVQSALYRPLAEKDFAKISSILSAARQYFRKLSKVLILYVGILAFVFPLVIETSESSVGVMFLIISMSISLFGQYYFGLTNQLLLNADQRAYLHVVVQIITIILNTIISIFLISNNYSIQFVKFSTGLVYLIRPVFLYWYTKKNYSINENALVTSGTLPQKWNGVAQHLAYTITNSTDIVLISLFSTLENVSVYSIYNMVLNGLRLLIISVTNGMQAFFGTLMTSNNMDKLNNYFSKLEWLIHTIVIFIFGMASTLIVDFVMIYTKGVYDANYEVPIFALIFTFAQTMYCLRLPYYNLVNAAGHFKETQISAIIEAIINVAISILTIKTFGLSGVAFGTLCAISYRAIYLVHYLSKNILKRKVRKFVKLLLVDILIMLVIFLISSIINYTPLYFIDWIKIATLKGLLFAIMTLLIQFIFFKDYVLYYLKKVLRSRNDG